MQFECHVTNTIFDLSTELRIFFLLQLLTNKILDGYRGSCSCSAFVLKENPCYRTVMLHARTYDYGINGMYLAGSFFIRD